MQDRLQEKKIYIYNFLGQNVEPRGLMHSKQVCTTELYGQP